MTFIDTNVLVYSVDTRDARKQRDLSDGQMYGSVKAVNPFKGL